ncbi:flagellar assembly protein FliW [Bacillus sp. AK031]
MKLETKYHGNIEIDKEDILKFSQGIPGFVNEKEFILLSLPENEWFQVLQSVRTPELGFVVTDPFVFFNDYDFKLDSSTINTLEKPAEQDIKVLSIVTVREPLHETTTNLQAPVIINLANNEAKQVIINETNYQTRHFIFQQPQKQGQEG